MMMRTLLAVYPSQLAACRHDDKEAEDKVPDELPIPSRGVRYNEVKTHYSFGPSQLWMRNQA